MSEQISDLEDHLGYWLRSLSNHVSGSFADRLKRYDVSVPQWVVLRVLYDGEGFTLKEVGEKVGVDQGALSRMIERLAGRGLVVRASSEESRREVAISLTKTGCDLVPRLASAADENDEAFFGHLSALQRTEFLAMIKSLLATNPATGMPIA